MPTWRYDNTHQGQNTQETILTPTNVNTNTFGKLFSQPVDGEVYAQPLYVSNLTINGAAHNVIFVATEHDSVYAFDADTNGGANSAPLWSASMFSTAHGAASGATTVPSTDVQSGTGDIHPEIGITGTPVIDLAAQTLFVLAKTKENGNYVQRLHALNILTGAERSGSPVALSASVPGNGNASSGGTLAFSVLWQNNRVAMDLFNGNLYLGFGSHGDDGPWHGWVLVYNETTLAQTGAMCTSPNGNGDGVWSSGAGFPIDTVTANGRAFVVTGNGDYTTYPPLNNNVDFGESILRYDLSNGGFAISDAFTPFNQNSLTGADLDQGSGGILMLPDQPGTYPHLLIQVGKEGRILVLNRDKLNGYAGSSAGYNTNAVQDITGALNSGNGLWSTPAYWNGNVYMWASSDTLKMFPLTNGVLATKPSSQSSATSSFPGASPMISSNGTQNGVLWVVTTDRYTSNGPSVLHAFNAANVAQEYYNSTQNTARDSAGQAVKFVIPVITNGKVYVGAWAQVDVYGLINQTQPAPAPVIAPSGGTYTGAQQITMTDSVSGATIYYTTNGSTPTTNSTQYVTGGFPLSANATVQAIASAGGYLQSAVTSATYAFNTQTPTPQYSPTPGSYTSTQSVTITDTNTSAAIYYTTDGSVPTTNSTLYSGAIAVSSNLVFNAIAVYNGLTNSAVATGSYNVQLPGTAINYANGFATVVGLTLNGSATAVDDSRLQLTTGVLNQTGSVFFNTPTNIQAFTTDFAFQLSNAVADGFTFTIQNVNATAIGGPGGGLGYGPDPAGAAGAGIAKSVAIKFDFYSNSGEGADSTGIYTNGATPTLPAFDMTSSGVVLSSGDTIDAHITYDGSSLVLTLTDIVVNKVFTHTFPVNIPGIVGRNTAYIGFTGASGSAGTASQKLLNWTLTSTTPTTTPTATPNFSPIAGSYASAQSVTISDTTPAAVIYYTTDGSTPTTASAVFGQTAIPVATSMTVKAIALATGDTQSPVGAAAYVIQSAAATPGFTPIAGTYTSAQSVTISDTTPAAVIYYTTNGSTPTTASAVYGSTAIPVTASMTVKAIAAASGYTQSAVGTAAYVIQTTTPPPTFAPIAGTYTSAQSVTLTDAGATLYYTTDGSTPTTNSAKYSAAIPVTGNTTVQAIGVVPGSVQSAVASATYVIQSAAPSTINFGGGFPSAAGLQLNGTSKVNANYLEITDGGMSEANSTFWTTPVNIQTFTTNFTFQINSAIGNGLTFTMQNAGLTAAGSLGGGLGYGLDPRTGTGAGIGNSVAVKFDIFNNIGEGTDSTGVYTNGVAPALPAVDLTSSGIKLASGDTISAQLVYDGATLTLNLTDTVTGNTFTHAFPINIPATVGANKAYVGFTGGTGSSANVQNIKTWTFSSALTPTAAEPVFNPTPGTYPTAQNVALTAAQGATIYYTVDGSTPTHASATYSAPIVASGVSLTVRAFASATGYQDSPIVLGTYQIQPATATPPPTFLPIAGTYASAQSVTLTDAGAAIYYTTDGSTPTTNSAKYSTAIPVTGNTTVRAIAVVPGSAQSAVASATYVIQSTAPSSINFAGGFPSAAGLQLNGTSKVNANYLEITDGGMSEANSTFWTTPVNIQTFTTNFTFQINSAIGNGLTFTMQNAGLTAAGSLGGGLGYGLDPRTGTGAGIGNSVAVKFDIFNNIGEGTDSTGVYTNGAAPALPAVDLTSSGIKLASGDTMSAQLVYDGTTLTLNLTDTVTGNTFTHAFPINIPATVGANTAYVGFTGGTGSSANVQNIKTWTFSSALTPTATVPAFNPTPGTYPTAQNVTLTAAQGATIYYTVDGSTPTHASAAYSTPIVVNVPALTIRAFASATGYQDSSIVVAPYQIQPGVVATPVISPATGTTFPSTLNVSMTDTTANSTIYYTTDGSIPTTGSTLYAGAVNITATMSFKAIAVASGMTSSSVATAAYTLVPPGAGINYSAGFTSTAGLTTNGTATNAGGSSLQVTTGATYQTGSAFYSTPIYIQAFTTDFTFQLTNAQADGMTFTIQNMGPNAIGGPGGGLGYGPDPTAGTGAGIANSVAVKFDFFSNAGEGSDSTGVYLNGATPTLPAVDMTASGVVLTSGDTMAAHMTYDGTNLVLTLTDTVTNKVFTHSFAVNIPSTIGSNTAYIGFTGASGGQTAVQKILTWTLTPQSGTVTQTSTPTFTPAGGTYASAQSVTIADTTPGALIYYTTNGSTPTTASAVYGNTAIPVAASETLEAMAVATGYTQSAVATAAYVIQSAAATPTFTPIAGTYAVAQSVTIADATQGAVIYYTTNGSTPTTASAVYGTTAIPVAASETLEAIAVATGYKQSAVATAAYVIQSAAATPTFTPIAGTYAVAQSVTIADATPGAVIYYTTNGSVPTTASAVYGATAIPVAASETLEAIAVATGYKQSAVATAAYVIQSASSTGVNFPTGFPSANGLQMNGSAKVNAGSLEVTDGGTYEAGSAFWTTPVNIQSFTTNFTFQLVSAVADGFTFTIQNTGPTAIGSFGGGLGYGLDPSGGTTAKIGNSVAVKFDFYNNSGEGNYSTGVFTNGAAPTTPAVNLTPSGIVLTSGDTISAQLIYSGTTLTLNLTDTVTNKTFTQAFTINIPTTVGANTAYVGFTGGTGGSTAIQNIKTWTLTTP